MGKVIVTAKIENLDDLFAVRRGLILPEQVKSIQVTDALVDTGATGLGVPKSLLDQLGLEFLRVRRAMTSAGATEVRVLGPVRLTIQGRDCPLDVMELPDGCPVLIGQIPLEAMDWVVDPGRQQLIGNPAHGGEHVVELY